MNPKLHKSKELNEIIENQNSEYINITKNLQIEGRPIVAGPVYYTSGISQMLHLILEPSLSFIPHILKDSFDFLERLDTTCTEDTLLSSCDIKSLYTNIHHDVFYKAIDYWIIYFRRTFNNFRIQLLLYQQLFLPPNQRNCYGNYFCCCWK